MPGDSTMFRPRQAAATRLPIDWTKSLMSSIGLPVLMSPADECQYTSYSSDCIQTHRLLIPWSLETLMSKAFDNTTRVDIVQVAN